MGAKGRRFGPTDPATAASGGFQTFRPDAPATGQRHEPVIVAVLKYRYGRSDWARPLCRRTSLAMTREWHESGRVDSEQHEARWPRYHAGVDQLALRHLINPNPSSAEARSVRLAGSGTLGVEVEVMKASLPVLVSCHDAKVMSKSAPIGIAAPVHV